jgi:hypothetical protein
MTGKFKDFGSGIEDKEPISFNLHGEEFKCYPAIQGKMLMKFAINADSGDVSKAASVVDDFFAIALLPESHARFTAILESKDKIVTVESLGEISGWLMEQYSSRPDTGSEPSSSGQ